MKSTTKWTQNVKVITDYDLIEDIKEKVAMSLMWSDRHKKEEILSALLNYLDSLKT